MLVFCKSNEIIYHSFLCQCFKVLKAFWTWVFKGFKDFKLFELFWWSWLPIIYRTISLQDEKILLYTPTTPIKWDPDNLSQSRKSYLPYSDNFLWKYDFAAARINSWLISIHHHHRFLIGNDLFLVNVHIASMLLQIHSVFLLLSN